MALRMTGRTRTALLLLGVLGVAALGFVLGGMVATDVGDLQPALDQAGNISPDAYAGDGRQDGTPAVTEGGVGSDFSKTTTEDSARGAGSSDADSMVIRNNGVELRVDDIEDAIDSIRRVAKAHGALITDMSVTGGTDPGPRPLVESTDAYPSPSYASLVLRVDADKLDALEAEVAKVGTVLSQTGTSSDVTQEYVDLSARLKNLQATEARLRGFTAKATKISDLLQIEAELSRVRGEIEAMQAQVKYLERQTAKATLNVSLREPGPLVQPSGNDWGFGDAIRRGIQSAAALITGLITFLIAILPLAVLLGIAWAVFMFLRRRKNRASQADSDE